MDRPMLFTCTPNRIFAWYCYIIFAMSTLAAVQLTAIARCSLCKCSWFSATQPDLPYFWTDVWWTAFPIHCILCILTDLYMLHCVLTIYYMLIFHIFHTEIWNRPHCSGSFTTFQYYVLRSLDILFYCIFCTEGDFRDKFYSVYYPGLLRCWLYDPETHSPQKRLRATSWPTIAPSVLVPETLPDTNCAKWLETMSLSQKTGWVHEDCLLESPLISKLPNGA